jgi:hypothetical protein
MKGPTKIGKAPNRCDEQGENNVDGPKKDERTS